MNNRRRRTRITEDQLKVLRQYFDINKSPSDEQITDIAQRTQLQAKVIKHWFRNTLFKERQKDKDSPYNFNNPPVTQLNLEEYEKTGKIVSNSADMPQVNLENTNNVSQSQSLLLDENREAASQLNAANSASMMLLMMNRNESAASSRHSSAASHSSSSGVSSPANNKENDLESEANATSHHALDSQSLNSSLSESYKQKSLHHSTNLTWVIEIMHINYDNTNNCIKLA